MLTLEQAGHELARALPLHFSVGAKDDPVRKDGFRQRLDVIRDHEGPAAHRGEGLARMEEVEGASRAGAEGDLWVAAGAADEPGHVFAQLGLDEDLADRALGAPELVWRDDRLQLQHRRLDLVLSEE